MWKLLVVSFCVITIADILTATTQNLIFRKCCPNNSTLMKFIDNQTNVGYTCIYNEEEYSTIEQKLSFIVENDNVTVHGLPENCDDQYSEIIPADGDIATEEGQCIETLTRDIYDGSTGVITPRTIKISCKKKSRDSLHFRKCCPEGMAFDVENHLCRQSVEYDDKQLLEDISKGKQVSYEVEHSLYCKPDQYRIDLSDEKVTFLIDGSSMTVSGDTFEKTIYRGDWCVDREYTNGKLVAQICTSDCKAFGAQCLKKCCPVGQHYVPINANTSRSLCTTNENKEEVPFNLSYYLTPLRTKYPEFKERIGIRPKLACNHGRYILDKMTDKPTLTKSGLLKLSIRTEEVTEEFCLENVDRRGYGGEIDFHTFACFQPPEETKNFQKSFVVVTISCVFLFLTLAVYLWLPELRNLHGRTLICHVSVMLVAFGCLARVQYQFVNDQILCTVYGYGIYFGFVAAFWWLNVICFDIWWTFGSIRSVQPFHKARSDRRRFILYSLYAWGLSVLMTTTIVLLDLYPVADYLDADIGIGICWFHSIQNSKNDWPHYIFFVIPMGLITGTNLVMWVLTARHCSQVKNEVHRMQAGSAGDRAKKRFQADRAKFVLTVRLWVVMGAGWACEVLSTIITEPKLLWHVIDTINELQGVFIFVILVLKPKVYHLIRKKIGLDKTTTRKNGASSSDRTSSTFLNRTISNDGRTYIGTSPSTKSK